MNAKDNLVSDNLLGLFTVRGGILVELLEASGLSRQEAHSNKPKCNL